MRKARGLEDNKKDFGEERMTKKAGEPNMIPGHIRCEASMHLRSFARLY